MGLCDMGLAFGGKGVSTIVCTVGEIVRDFWQVRRWNGA